MVIIKRSLFKKGTYIWLKLFGNPGIFLSSPLKPELSMYIEISMDMNSSVSKGTIWSA